MANKEIKHTIRLEGEKEYSAAIREAQRNLKTLRSELKAETAELGSNATAQQKNEARAKSLKAQIAEQEKVVETLKKALAEAKKDYGDNEDVVQKWEQKLNEARTTLANMQNGLADTENAMRGVSDATAQGVVATKSFADALGDIASVGESVSSAIEDIFTGLISTVSDTIVELWDLIGETAAKANRWTDIAGYWNTDPANIEKWARAIEASGNSFEDLETIVTRLVLGGKGKDIAEMLGVSDVNYEDQWDYAMAVLERIYELRSSGNLPDNLWETLFGEKKATKAMDIINDWEAVQKGLTTYNADEGGYGLGTEALQTMNDLYEQISDVEGRWEALKAKFAGEFGHLTADLLVNVSGSLDALNDYMNADTDADRDAALKKIEENITEFFEKVASYIEAGLEIVNHVGENLSQSDNPIVSAIGKLLVTLTLLGKWLIENADKVKTAMAQIFGVWLIAKLAIIGGKIASILADIKVIKEFGNYSGSGAGSALSGGGSAAGAAASGSVVVGGMYDTIGSGLASSLLVSQELFRLRIKQEDIDEIADFGKKYGAALQAIDAWRDRMTSPGGGSFLPSPEELTKMGYNTGLESPYIIGLDPNYWDNANAQDFGADAGNVIADRLEGLFGGTEQNGQNGLNGDDLSVFRGLPGLLRQALFTQISGMKVVMDGETVGRIVTPYVSGGIALKVVELQ